MNENEVGKIIVDCAFQVHNALGPGLFETVYEVALLHEICKRGLQAERQVPIPIQYDGIEFEEGFRADIIVESIVILELKSVEAIHRVHKKQLLTYLRLADKRLGYLINFGEELIKNGISRVANGVDDWSTRSREGAKEVTE